MYSVTEKDLHNIQQVGTRSGSLCGPPA